MSSRRKLFERDLSDNIIYTRELLLVFWRFNPVGIVSSSIDRALEDINEHTPNNERAAIVGSALANTELQDPSEFVKTYVEVASGVGGASHDEYIEKVGRTYPDVVDFLQARCARDSKDMGLMFGSMVRRAVDSQKHHYDQQARHFAQLQEYFPRYYDIMTATGLLKMAVGFAAGFFTGGLGVVGMEVWENWRGSTDQDFVNLFAAALGEFVESGFAYTAEGEKSLRPVIDRLCEDLRENDQRLFDAIDDLEESGWEIGPFYEAYRDLPCEERDEDTVFLFQTAMENLEDNSAVSTSTIQNLRQMWKEYLELPPPTEEESKAAQREVPCCPHGHGETRLWDGVPRCWTCGWTPK